MQLGKAEQNLLQMHKTSLLPPTRCSVPDKRLFSKVCFSKHSHVSPNAAVSAGDKWAQCCDARGLRLLPVALKSICE